VFILGLILGPALGLLAGDFARSRVRLTTWVAVGATLFALAILALLPLGDIELRLGLVAGIGVGFLLAVTPEETVPAPE
jgi:hypothetical protein